MITKAPPFPKLSLFRSICAAIVSASPATMPTLGMKEDWDGPKCKPPTSRTGPSVAPVLGALTLCFALSAAAQPPWGSGGTVTSPFKDAEAPPTNLVCNLSDTRSNVEITTQPSAEIPFSEFTEASLDISGLQVCSEFSRADGTLVRGPGLFELVQTTPLVAFPGPPFAGWAVATLEDMNDLGASAGITQGSTDPAQIAVAEQLRDWFCPPDHPNGDCAIPSSTHDVARGLIADIRTADPPLDPPQQLAFSVGRRFNVTPNEVDFRISGFDPSGGTSQSEQTYLVRDLIECEQTAPVALVGDATFGPGSVIRIRIVDTTRCRDYLRLSETIPFSYNEVIAGMVTTVSSGKSTPGFAFEEVCNEFDVTGQVCIDLTRTWTVTALYDEFDALLTDIRYELVAVDDAARGFCDPPPSEGENCKVFYGLEDPRFSTFAPVDGQVVIEVETTTITASPAEETPRPDVVWNLCHTQAFEVVSPSQGNLFAGTDHEEFSSIFGETGQDRLYRATTNGPVVTGSTIITTNYPLNGLGEGSGFFLFAGQPETVGGFPGNTLRRIDFSGNLLASFPAAIPAEDCCNEEMVLFDGALYHAYFDDVFPFDEGGIRKLDPDDGSLIEFFSQPDVVGMAVINNQIWITKWNGREVGTWDPGTNTFTPVFSTNTEVFGFSRAGALAWDPVDQVLWLGLQGGNVIPVDLNGNPKGDVIQPFGSIGNTVDGLAFASLSGEGILPIDCTAVVNGEEQSAVTESDEFVAEHQVQIEVIPTLNLNTGPSDAVLPAVVLGCKVEPNAIEFDPDGGPVFPAFAFVNGLTELPIVVERFSVNDTRSSPSCDGGEALDDLNLKLNKFDFINAVKAAIPFCENRKASVPLSISVADNIVGFEGLLAGTAVVDLSNCEVVD